MRLQRTLARGIAAVAFAALLAPAPARGVEDAFARGIEAYERSHWPEAMSWFEIAAEEDGSLRAKEILAYMNLIGPQLYPGLQRDVSRAKVWLQRAAQQGSTEAARLLVRLERDDAAQPLPVSAGVRK